MARLLINTMYSNKYDKIKGIWTAKTYTILKSLGAGGVGEIYLVEDKEGRRLALKLSEDMISITKEFNFLCRLKHKDFIPKAFDLDDFIKQGKTYHYFTMEYIEGNNLKSVIRNSHLNFETKLGIVNIIIEAIRQINEVGYIYTDLKHENIMIDEKNKLIKLIDLGSLVEVGNTVKEYTPMYDRLCWGKGRRIADLSYQIFVIAILFTTMLLNRRLDPDKEKLELAIRSLRKRKVPKKIYEVIISCIEGKIKDCETLCSEIGCTAECSKTYQGKLNMALNILISILSLIITATIFAYR